MTAAEVKEILRRRYPATQTMGLLRVPGPWTCIEEWAGVDLLAVGATAGADRYAWIGHEVKVSRGDLRTELLNPSKRAAGVLSCDRFFFVVPPGLLSAEEIAWEEPQWTNGDFARRSCKTCLDHRISRMQRRIHDAPLRGSLIWDREAGRYLTCPDCEGAGHLERSRVEREAPSLWIPKDVGLLIAYKNGCRVARKAPKTPVPATIGRRDAAALVRWVSARPDPRHEGLVEEARQRSRELRR